MTTDREPTDPNGGGSRDSLALRIDVDFAVGLRRAVPRILDRLRGAGMSATFFVVAGRNSPGDSLRRMMKSEYRTRLRKLGLARLVGRLGPAAFRESGGFLDGDDAPGILRRIVDEGHELAVHGFDHAWWADHVWTADAAMLGAEIDRGFHAMERATGLAGLAWGSPNWRTTLSVLRYLDRRGVPYFSDCWGRGPFLTRDELGGTIPVPHLPINLPSLESMMVEGGLRPREAVRALLESHGTTACGVACFHDYFEGLLRPELLERFLDECGRRGVRTTSLLDVATSLRRAGAILPVHRLRRARLAGFLGEVTWQGDAAPDLSARSSRTA